MNARLSARWNARLSALCRLRLLLALVLVMATAALCAQSEAQSSVTARHLNVSLVTDTTSVAADSSHRTVPPHVGLLFDLEPGLGDRWLAYVALAPASVIEDLLVGGSGSGPAEVPYPTGE